MEMTQQLGLVGEASCYLICVVLRILRMDTCQKQGKASALGVKLVMKLQGNGF